MVNLPKQQVTNIMGTDGMLFHRCYPQEPDIGHFQFKIKYIILAELANSKHTLLLYLKFSNFLIIFGAVTKNFNKII